MYNHYQHSHRFYPIGTENFQPSSEEPPLSHQKNTSEKSDHGFASILDQIKNTFRLNQFDSGDNILFLIILFLFLEGDNLELIITLGLMLLLSLNDD